MSIRRLRHRLLSTVVAALAAAGCSITHDDTRRPASAAHAPSSAASVARASAPASQPATIPASVPASNWDPAVAHLDAQVLVGQTWIFPSSSPARYGDDRFVFRRDRVEASNARDHATGTWTVENDKLCVTLNAGAWGRACYVVTGSPAGGFQIRVLLDGDRVPLKIQ